METKLDNPARQRNYHFRNIQNQTLEPECVFCFFLLVLLSVTELDKVFFLESFQWWPFTLDFSHTNGYAKFCNYSVKTCLLELVEAPVCLSPQLALEKPRLLMPRSNIRLWESCVSSYRSSILPLSFPPLNLEEGVGNKPAKSFLFVLQTLVKCLCSNYNWFE